MVIKFIRFGLIGVISTLIGISSYYILLERMALPLYPVYVGVWTLVVFISYILNTWFNYKKDFHLKDLIKYYGGYLSGLVVGLILLYILKSLDTGFSDFVLTIIVIIPRFILVFLIVDKFAYKYE